jgi:branched-subunit amino acid transport protein
MNIWVVMIFLGLLTFATRLSFIALLERIKLPVTFQRALRFVPIAVLSAIIAPELGYYNNALALSPTNPRLLAGLVATLVAWRTKSVIWTILAGMAVFWLLRLWL